MQESFPFYFSPFLATFGINLINLLFAVVNFNNIWNYKNLTANFKVLPNMVKLRYQMLIAILFNLFQ